MVTSRELSLKRKNNELIETLLSVKNHLHKDMEEHQDILNMVNSEDMTQIVKIHPSLKKMMDDDRFMIENITGKLKEVL
jgi:hypothetical protein